MPSKEEKKRVNAAIKAKEKAEKIKWNKKHGVYDPADATPKRKAKPIVVAKSKAKAKAPVKPKAAGVKKTAVPKKAVAKKKTK